MTWQDLYFGLNLKEMLLLSLVILAKWQAKSDIKSGAIVLDQLGSHCCMLPPSKDDCKYLWAVMCQAAYALCPKATKAVVKAMSQFISLCDIHRVVKTDQPTLKPRCSRTLSLNSEVTLAGPTLSWAYIVCCWLQKRQYRWALVSVQSICFWTLYPSIGSSAKWLATVWAPTTWLCGLFYVLRACKVVKFRLETSEI